MVNSSQVAGTPVKVSDITELFKVQGMIKSEYERLTEIDQHTLYLVNEGSGIDEKPYTDIYWGGRKCTDLYLLDHIPSDPSYPDDKLYLVLIETDKVFSYNLYVKKDGRPVSVSSFSADSIQHNKEDGVVEIIWNNEMKDYSVLVTADYDADQGSYFLSDKIKIDDDNVNDSSLSLSKINFNQEMDKVEDSDKELDYLGRDGQWKRITCKDSITLTKSQEDIDKLSIGLSTSDSDSVSLNQTNDTLSACIKYSSTNSVDLSVEESSGLKADVNVKDSPTILIEAERGIEARLKYESSPTIVMSETNEKGLRADVKFGPPSSTVAMSVAELGLTADLRVANTNTIAFDITDRLKANIRWRDTDTILYSSDAFGIKPEVRISSPSHFISIDVSTVVGSQGLVANLKTSEEDDRGKYLVVDDTGEVVAQDLPAFATSVSELTDVDLTNPSDGQSLVYQEGKWVNRTISSGGGGSSGGASTLDDLSDVTTASLALDSGMVLKYDANDSQWKPADDGIDEGFIG